MADEIITIATLEIDSSKAVGTIEQTKKSIWDLQAANTALRKEIKLSGDATGEQTAAFVANEQEIKRLNQVYKAQEASLNSVTLAQLKESDAYKQSAKSIAQAEAQNKELLALKKQINLTTPEGIKAMELLNAKTDENTRLIKQNDNADQARQSNIGKYPGTMGLASAAMGGFISQVQEGHKAVVGFGKTVSEASDTVTNMVASTVQGARSFIGFKTSAVQATAATETQAGANTILATTTEEVVTANTLASASFNVLKLAIISTGIGAIVIAAVALYTAISRNEAASNKFAKILSTIGGVLAPIMDILEKLGSVILDRVGVAFEQLGRVAEKTLGLISKGLKAFGFDDAAKAVDNFTTATKKSIASARILADAEAKYTQAQRLAEKVQLDAQKRAEKLRQLRDDESKFIQTRIAANTQLGIELKKQQNAELSIANQAVSIANLRARLYGKTKENLDAIAEAQTKVSDIQERISGQESEQLQNLNSLRKEAADKQKAAAALKLDQQTKALNNTILVFETEKRTAEEQITFYQDYYKKLDALQGGKDKLKNAQDLSSKLLSIATTSISEELKLQQTANEEKKKISQQQKDDLLANSLFLKEEQTRRVESALLSEKDKAKALEAINAGYLENVKVINQNFKDSEAARRAEELTLTEALNELTLLNLADQKVKETEIQKIALSQQLADKKAALDEDFISSKRSAEEVRILKEVEDKKYAQATKKINKEIADQKRAQNVGMVKDALTAASAIFGDNKALAVASALVNTYEGISAGVKLGYPAAIPAVAAAAATGFAAVKNILSTKKGDTGGSSTSSGSSSTSVFASPAKTDTVAKLEAAPVQQNAPSFQPVLVLEHFDEVKNQQIVKVGSD